MSIKTTVKTYSNAGKDFDLYVVSPDNQSEKRPAIFIAHAWDGLNEPMMEIARHVAALNYVAVAVDVYGKGVRGDPVGDNTHLMAPLMEDRKLLNDRILAAYNVIQNMENVDETRIGAIGYCFGGYCVLDLARAVPGGLKAVVSFHGGLTTNNLPSSGPIKASILIEHGWDDPIVPHDDFLAFTKEMDERQADWQAHVHGGAAHAFTFDKADMPDRGIQYHEAAARRSWQSMIDFFEETL
jgi:dienelactone hydrolase